jgi:KilA-N domain
MTQNIKNTQLVVRGRVLSEDEHGRICLDDLWALAEAKDTKKPKFWRLGAAAKSLKNALLNKVRNSNLKANEADVIHAPRGQGMKGTYAHPILAAAYAGYLDPNLEVETREVWLRYRSGDASLADEILQRASAEANHWAGVRALSRSKRNDYTDTLKAHGVADKGYMLCTEAVYQHLLGGRSHELRNKMSLPANTNIRDHLDANKLAFVMAAEALAIERIREEGRQGNEACITASVKCASAIKSAIDADRRNRTKAA